MDDLNKNPNNDKETQEIIDDMEKDKVIEKEPDKKPEEKKEEFKSPYEDVDEKKEEKKEDKEEKKEEVKEDKKEEEYKPNRSIRAMPLSKYKKQKEKWETTVDELKNEIADLKQGDKKEDREETKEKIDDAVKSFAEKHKLDKDVISELSNVIAKKVSLPKDTLNKINKLISSNNETYQDAMFDKDFNNLVGKHEKAKDLKKEIKELAFTEEFAKTPIEAIYYYINSKKSKGKKSMENSKSKSQKGKYKDYSDIDGEDIKNMSDKEFDDFSEEMGKKGSRLRFDKR